MSEIIKMFYDLETTGVDPQKHSIHQISGIIEINGVIFEEFDIKTRPHSKCQYDEGALRICNKTKEELGDYPRMKESYQELIGILGTYINKFDNKQKIWNIGFNNRAFDDVFLRAWFLQNNDNFIGSWFWNDTIDVLILASQYLINRRAQMSSFKLKRVAKELGIIVDETKLHNASYDVYLTREIYRIVTGLEYEL